jgi:tetratricopeptide (TPR) repeat protein
VNPWLVIPLVCALGMGTSALALAVEEEEGEGEETSIPDDPKAFGKTPEELWQQVETFFINKQWIQCCARLDRLRETGQDLKKKKTKASYAYTRCAAIHVKVGKLKNADDALELGKQLGGDESSRKPVEADLHRTLAKMSLDKGDLPDALAHYEIAAAKHPDERKEQDASLTLSKFAAVAYSAGKTLEAKEAVQAALIYYPANRDAVKLRDSLTFWDRAWYWVAGAVALLVALGVAVKLKGRGGRSASVDPYDPYAAQ